MTFAAIIYAAAADAAPVNEFGMWDGGPTPTAITRGLTCLELMSISGRKMG
ncbi:hypothetical protein NAP1_06695 [Erythrobacter sp. NAP1]|uniref:hypothetical protein n=1 Tax=Erythrobacter sp. NAP1 TaxID=237727 RepID=UPI0000686D00|nr:hypothetical protein [Erythrobacter sp. NAP1]EAQ30445.1 hypothetical protein NAP1_06695 [Erythrobacter sp. NAP1]